MQFIVSSKQRNRKRVSCIESSLESASRCPCWLDREARDGDEECSDNENVGIEGLVDGLIEHDENEDDGARNCEKAIVSDMLRSLS